MSYSLKSDPYLDFLNTDSLLFSSKQPPTGKPDSLKFSYPLSFGEKRGEEAGQDNLSRHSQEEDEASAPPVDYLGYIQVKLQ